MKKILALILVLCLVLAAVPVLAENDLTGSPSGEPALTLVEENFYLRKSYGDKYNGVYIAKFRNDTNTPLYIDRGSLTLLDADGNEVGKQDYLDPSGCGSRYLESGEVSFVSLIARVNDGASVEKFETDFKVVQTDNLVLHDTAIDLAGAELRASEGPYQNYYAAATITNSSDAPLSGVNAVVALRASDGSLIQLVTAGLGQNELGSGSTITLINHVDNQVVTYCTENNLNLTDVEAYAWQSNAY